MPGLCLYFHILYLHHAAGGKRMGKVSTILEHFSRMESRWKALWDPRHQGHSRRGEGPEVFHQPEEHESQGRAILGGDLTNPSSPHTCHFCKLSPPKPPSSPTQASGLHLRRRLWAPGCWERPPSAWGAGMANSELLEMAWVTGMGDGKAGGSRLVFSELHSACKADAS